MRFCAKCGKKQSFLDRWGTNGTIDSCYPEFKGKKLCDSCRAELVDKIYNKPLAEQRISREGSNLNQKTHQVEYSRQPKDELSIGNILDAVRDKASNHNQEQNKEQKKEQRYCTYLFQYVILSRTPGWSWGLTCQNQSCLQRCRHNMATQIALKTAVDFTQARSFPGMSEDEAKDIAVSMGVKDYAPTHS